MLGWNPSFNWTHDEIKDAIHQLFDVEKRTKATIDVEHADAKNMRDIINWCKELGYDAAEASGGDIIHIWIPEPEPEKPLMTYKIEVTKTGFISIQARSPEEALKQIQNMNETDFMWKDAWREDAKIIK